MIRKFDDALYCEECEHFKREIWNGEGHCEKLNRFFHKWSLCIIKYGVSWHITITTSAATSNALSGSTARGIWYTRMASGNIVMSWEVALIINFLKNRIMEIFIYCYLAVSYLIMIGCANELREDKGWSIKDKTEMAILFIIVLCAPFVIPFIIGGVLYKLMKLVWRKKRNGE